MAVGDAHVFPGFLTPVLTQLFFQKPLTSFLTCFCSGERKKYAEKKSRLNWGLNSQPPGHESYKLTTKPQGRGKDLKSVMYLWNRAKTNFPNKPLFLCVQYKYFENTGKRRNCS